MSVSGGSGGRENVAFSLKPIPNGSRLHQLDPQYQIDLVALVGRPQHNDKLQFVLQTAQCPMALNSGISHVKSLENQVHNASRVMHQNV